MNTLNIEGAVVPHSVPNVWELRINGIKNCKGLFNYFDQYKLLTKKRESYIKWQNICVRLSNKEHLNQDTRLELYNLSKQINK